MGYDETLRDFRDLVLDEKGLLDAVRSVAIDHVNIDVKRPWESYNKASLLRGFKKLEEVVLVLGNTEDRGKRGEEIEFLDAKEDPERLLRIWYFFRLSFGIEEKVLEDVCREMGMEFESYNLPIVRIKEKVLRREGRGSGVEDIERALERMRV